MNIIELEKEYPETTIVLKHMCDVINVPHSVINKNTKKKLWCQRYKWDESQQEIFKDWFCDYLYTHPKARREIMGFPIKNKNKIKQTFAMFNLNYGWSLK